MKQIPNPSSWGGGAARQAILALLRQGRAMTADEIAEYFGVHVLRTRPRIAELSKGLLPRRMPLPGGIQIVDSGERGSTALGTPAIKWIIA